MCIILDMFIIQLFNSCRLFNALILFIRLVLSGSDITVFVHSDWSYPGFTLGKQEVPGKLKTFYN